MNKQEKELIAKGIAAVRKTGRTNMFDMNVVIQIMKELGYNESVETLFFKLNGQERSREEKISLYIQCLKYSANY